MRKITLFIISIFFTINSAQAQWAELGGDNALSATNDINALEKDDSGNIYVAGKFKNSANKIYVSKFDGTSWTTVGDPNYFLGAYSKIQSIHYNNGKLYVAGDVVNAGGNYIVAVYDGTTWSELGGDTALQIDRTINVVTSDKNGNIYAAGYFKNSNGFLYVAKYDGTSWNELGVADSFNKKGSEIHDIAFDSNNNVYVVGDFSGQIAKYDGNSWTTLSGISAVAEFGVNSLQTIKIDNNDNIYTAGMIPNSTFRNLVAKYDGTNWTELGGKNSLSKSGYINTLALDSNNGVYIGGNLRNGTSNRYIAKFDGNSWSELEGDNSLIANGDIQDMVVTNDNKLAVAGSFKNTSGNRYVAISEGALLSIGEVVNERGLLFFTDFTTNTLHIQPNNHVITDITIYNITGQKLQSYGKNQLNIDISSFDKGVYLVNIKTSDKVISKKFIKN